MLQGILFPRKGRFVFTQNVRGYSKYQRSVLKKVRMDVCAYMCLSLSKKFISDITLPIWENFVFSINLHRNCFSD